MKRINSTLYLSRRRKTVRTDNDEENESENNKLPDMNEGDELSFKENAS